MAFWKPGASAPGHDRGAPTTVLFNPNHRLPLHRQRQRLPIYQHRLQILYALESHDVLIIVGETGSGKTTQVPQYLFEGGWAAGGRVVACTQPRRVAAVAVASRVAQELGSPLGQTCGYTVRFDHCATEATRIKYLTEGTLLRETMTDPLLSRYSVIMIDEAHERNVTTDVLLGLLKKIRRKRPELRLIIASATLEAEAFRDFFSRRAYTRAEAREAALAFTAGKPPPAFVTSSSSGGSGKPQPAARVAILTVRGRQYPVDIMYAEKPMSNYLEMAVRTVLRIHASEAAGSGGILVFMPGQEEVDSVVREIRNRAPSGSGSGAYGSSSSSSGRRGSKDVLNVLPMYGALPTKLQMRVFDRPRRGVRKVIVATNIAETSVTIDGISFVVDAGFVKLPSYDAGTGMHSLVTQPVSQAQATQRTGRAGRQRPGKAYRLYTYDSFSKLRPATMPEMRRTPLASVVLQLKALGIDDVLHFDFIAPPPPESLARALTLLFALGALDLGGRLTPVLGRRLAEFPVSPMLAKMLIASFNYGCGVEALSLAAMLSVRRIWERPRGRRDTEKQREFEATYKDFASKEGDHTTLLNVYREYAAQPQRGRSNWCHENFLNPRILARAAEVRAQLERYLRRLRPLALAGEEEEEGLARSGERQEILSCEEDTESLSKCLVAGFFSHVARLQSDGNYRTVQDGRHVAIHGESALFKLSQVHPWVIYDHACLTTAEYMHEVSKVNPLLLTEIAPHFYKVRKVKHGHRPRDRGDGSRKRRGGGGGGGGDGRATWDGTRRGSKRKAAIDDDDDRRDGGRRRRGSGSGRRDTTTGKRSSGGKGMIGNASDLRVLFG